MRTDNKNFDFMEGQNRMILRAFIALYRSAWVFLAPVLLIYIWKRSRLDAIYSSHLGERFGWYKPLPQNAVWIHAVSLGETRSAVPLARLLLAQGETVVFTHFTPAGRQEAERTFAPEIATGSVAVVWVPLDMYWVQARFLKACRPKIGLTMEIEIWPAMILVAKRLGVPLYLCNAQYPNKSITRDSKGARIRQRIMANVAGAFVKSPLQASRFTAAGVPNIQVTGELRFDQSVPAALLGAAKIHRAALRGAAGRPIITIASSVEGEDPLYIDAIQKLQSVSPAPLVIYVPRAPERFDAVAHKLGLAGLRFARRSEALGHGLEGLNCQATLPADIDVLLGDSLGEMYFYLALADRVIVGGGFHPKGAHNIIEPLALSKPVITGPHTHKIEFPFVEAEAAGVVVSVRDSEALVSTLKGPDWVASTQIDAFLSAHSGAAKRTLKAINAELALLNREKRRHGLSNPT
jgi:3-deoxy-D-manno-octulosonic-acid transferase